jgi:hypothetical protein
MARAPGATPRRGAGRSGAGQYGVDNDALIVLSDRRLSVGFGQCLLGFQRVVDDDHVRTPSSQHAADRGGDATALRRGLEFGHRLMPRRQASRKDPPVPVAGDDAPAVARQFVGELLRIGDAEDLRTRMAAQTPGRKRDRRQ